MKLHLIFVLAAFIPRTEAQERVRELEKRLCQAPAASVVSKNADISRKHLRKLNDASAAIPEHRREAYAKQVHDAKELWVVWHSLDKAMTLLNEAKCLDDQGKEDDRDKYKTVPELKFLVRTVPELLEEAELYTRVLKRFIGEEAFAAGHMPPPVPVWRFQRID